MIRHQLVINSHGIIINEHFTVVKTQCIINAIAQNCSPVTNVTPREEYLPSCRVSTAIGHFPIKWKTNNRIVYPENCN